MFENLDMYTDLLWHSLVFRDKTVGNISVVCCIFLTQLQIFLAALFSLYFSGVEQLQPEFLISSEFIELRMN